MFSLRIWGMLEVVEEADQSLIISLVMVGLEEHIYSENNMHWNVALIVMARR